MNATITTPAGNKVRTKTQRRYVVMCDHTRADGTQEGWVATRTDRAASAQATVVSRGPVVRFADGSTSTFSAYDTITGQRIA